MKKVILLSLMLHTLFGYTQTKENVLPDDFVECYFDNTTSDSLVIYDSINGEHLLSLKMGQENRKNFWYKVTIKQTISGWAQIQNIQIVPNRNSRSQNELKTYVGSWIKIENLKIDIADISLPDSLGVPFYSEPTLQSEIICKSGKFLKLNLLAVNDKWAKVSFVHKGILYNAWIEGKNQCASPWTSCPFNP
jgi:hypothetical protein